MNTAPLLQPDPKDEVEWDGDGEVDVTVDLEENGLVEIEVRWKPELGRRPEGASHTEEHNILTDIVRKGEPNICTATFLLVSQ